MTQVNLSEVLASNYLLADLSVRTWGATVTDREASEALTAANGAATDSARVVKKLLAGNDKLLKETQSSFNGIRTWFYEHTLPWTTSTDGNRRGKRLVGAVDATTFLTEFATRKKAAEASLAQFLTQYDALVAGAAGQLVGLYKASDYPSRDEVARSFGAQMRLDPVPAQTDFTRVPLPAAITAGLQRLYEQQAAEQVGNAMADFHDRLSDELLRLSTQLMKVVRGEKAKLYKTLLTNLQGLVRLARSLVPLDAKLGDVATRIEQELLTHDIEAFKENIGLSRQIAERADALRTELATPGQAPVAQTVTAPTPTPVAQVAAEPAPDLSAAPTDALLAAADEFDVDAMLL